MKIVNVNVIVVKENIVIKLKSLLFEEENKYPTDAPEHFGGGENLDVFGYQTKHFDICKSATTLYEKLIQNEEAKDLILQTAKDFDHLFEMEKQVVAKEELDHDPVKHAVELCNTISFKLGRIAEITNHGDEEDDTHFIQMHVMVIISRSKQPTNENLRKWFSDKWVNIGKKDKSGKHPPCGTSGKKRGYAKCVPASKARGMSKKEKESATRRKRAAQNKKGRGGTSSLSGGGKKPIRVSTKPKK